MIYQESNGSNNKDKQPAGGVIFLSTLANSMMETIKNPIIFYGNGAVINQEGHMKSLWDYYWTSYSRGTDGSIKNDGGWKDDNGWHDDYLDGYTSQRLKSIFDPCPHGFRVPINGVWNSFEAFTGWVGGSSCGGTIGVVNSKKTWLLGLGYKFQNFQLVGSRGTYFSSTIGSKTTAYVLMLEFYALVYTSRYNWNQLSGSSVRCIEDSWRFVYHRF